MIQNGISAAFTFQSGGLPINFDLMCLQCEKISFLALRVAKVEFITMLNLSLIRQSRQVLFIGLNVGIFFFQYFPAYSWVGTNPILDHFFV